MPQASTVLANQPFPTFRSNLNNALGALLTNNSGSTAPTSPTENQLWVDTSTTPYTLKIRAASSWVTVGRVQSDFGHVQFDNPQVTTEPLVTGTANAFASLANGRCPTKGAIDTYLTTNPSFINATLLNSWTNQAGNNAGYRKMPIQNMVELTGRVQLNNPPANSVIYTLPAGGGFRPPKDLSLSVVVGLQSGAAEGRLRIEAATGNIVNVLSFTSSPTVLVFDATFYIGGN